MNEGRKVGTVAKGGEGVWKRWNGLIICGARSVGSVDEKYCIGHADMIGCLKARKF